jgi:hypothetical protein
VGEVREAGKRPAGAAVKEQRRGGDRLEVKGDPDGWAPPVSERVREREEGERWRLVGLLGQKGAGRGRKEVGWARGKVR